MAVHQRGGFREERERDLGQPLLDHAHQRCRDGHAQVQDAPRHDDADDGTLPEYRKTRRTAAPWWWTRNR